MSVKATGDTAFGVEDAIGVLDKIGGRKAKADIGVAPKQDTKISLGRCL